MVAVRGEQFYKEHTSTRTWRRYKALFSRLHIEWNDTDVLSLSTVSPPPMFIPHSSDQRVVA